MFVANIVYKRFLDLDWRIQEDIVVANGGDLGDSLYSLLKKCSKNGTIHKVWAAIEEQHPVKQNMRNPYLGK